MIEPIKYEIRRSELERNPPIGRSIEKKDFNAYNRRDNRYREYHRELLATALFSVHQPGYYQGQYQYYHNTGHITDRQKYNFCCCSSRQQPKRHKRSPESDLTALSLKSSENEWNQNLHIPSYYNVVQSSCTRPMCVWLCLSVPHTSTISHSYGTEISIADQAWQYQK